ncbi:MAG: imidazolonepropionase, partial [Candidatus Acidiferrales bacterium]
SQLLTLRGAAPRRGRAMQDLGIIRGAALLVRDGAVRSVGTRKKIETLPEAKRAKKIDLGGRVVLPGFVDSHTHLIFAESRALEYEKRIAGATYEQIAKSGGGILSSVRKLRAATPDDLKARALGHLRNFAAHGTTTLEAKTGYGLDLASEMKTLEIINDLRRAQPLDIASTFLGAHAVPPEYRRRPDDYADLVARIWIPFIARTGLAQFCDVYCDRGAFTVPQAEHILTAGLVVGMAPRIHAEQLARTGAARLAVKLHAASADHLEKINRGDIRALAASGVACTLLPGCCFHLGIPHDAPARELIAAGAIVALATDFNPGTSPTLNMQVILSIACNQLGMTPAEAITASTINAAYALRRHERIGSLEPGKFADLAAFDVDDYREIPYYFGVNTCAITVKRGELIYSRNAR